MICKKEHHYLNEYNSLPEAQDNQHGDRHICAGCAYEEGLQDGLEGKAKKTDLSHLPYSFLSPSRLLTIKSTPTFLHTIFEWPQQSSPW